MKKIILITGASSGFGRLTAEALARAGHTVYASMRDLKGRNAANVEAMAKFNKDNGVDLRTVELDVQSQDSANKAIETVIADSGRVDVLIHNAGHMVFGPASLYRRAVRPALRQQRAWHPARQPRRPAPYAQAKTGLAGVGLQQ